MFPIIIFKYLSCFLILALTSVILMILMYIPSSLYLLLLSCIHDLPSLTLSCISIVSIFYCLQMNQLEGNRNPVIKNVKIQTPYFCGYSILSFFLLVYRVKTKTKTIALTTKTLSKPKVILWPISMYNINRNYLKYWNKFNKSYHPNL